MDAGRRSSKGPAALTLLGVAITVVGWGIFAVAMVVVGADVWDDTGGSLDHRDDIEGEATVPGRAEVALPAGDWVVLALGPDLTFSTSGADPGSARVERGAWEEPSVVVTTADGGPVATRPPALEVLRDTPGGDAASLTAFTLDDPTTVVLAAEGGDGAVTAIGIGEEETFGDIVKGYALPTVVAVVGALIGSVGPFVAIGGAVWWMLRAAGSGPRRGGPTYPPGTFGPGPGAHGDGRGVRMR